MPREPNRIVFLQCKQDLPSKYLLLPESKENHLDVSSVCNIDVYTKDLQAKVKEQKTLQKRRIKFPLQQFQIFLHGHFTQ